MTYSQTLVCVNQLGGRNECIHLTDHLLGGQPRANQIEVSLNEDIKSKEERKTKQGHWIQKTTLCAPSAKAAQAAGVRNITI